ncbi:MAG: methionine--tRNA ligase subunit beta, partial [Nitrospirota bacterium]
NVHLVGKDILTTHAVYWSTMLMALNLPLPETIFAHGWWTVNGEKMSKSRGNVVDPNRMIDEFGVDAFRYFLLREVPFGQDGDFSEHAMARRANSDLANGIGNLLSRTLTMIDRNCDGTIPDVPQDYLEKESRKYPLLLYAKQQLLMLGKTGGLDGFFENLKFNDLLLYITTQATNVDIFIDEHEPWRLAKDPDKRKELDTILYTAAECLRIMSLFIYPFMPSTAKKIVEQLGLNIHFDSPLLSQEIKWGDLQSGTKIRKGSALFPRIELKPQGAKTVSESPATPQPLPAAAATTSIPTPAAPAATPAPVAPTQITIDEFMKIQLKTAKVITAERVPKSEKLLKLQVSLGEGAGAEQRQIVAGIGKKYEPEALIGKTIVIVANLKPAKLMGIESQGMVLAAGESDVRGLVTLLEDVEPGTKVK